MLFTAEVEAALNAETGPACAVDPDGVLLFINRAWDSYVVPPSTPRACRKELLGQNWTGFFSAEAATFYGRLLALALALPQASRSALLHTSQCNTPTLVRTSYATFAPVYDGGAVVGCALLYGLEDVGSPARVYGVAQEPLDAYRGSNGMMQQCGCCRRLNHPKTQHWDFVVAALAPALSGVEDVLCGTCRARYRGDPQPVKHPWLH